MGMPGKEVKKALLGENTPDLSWPKAERLGIFFYPIPPVVGGALFPGDLIPWHSQPAHHPDENTPASSEISSTGSHEDL